MKPSAPLARALLLAGLLVVAAGPALAGSTLTLFDGMLVYRMSADGTACAGNSADGFYTACRWTAADGVVNLGRSAGEILGRSAGMPGISADGTRISSSIVTEDSLAMTQGRWTLGQGWEQTMPPQPPGGVTIDQSMGTAWGISSDGSTVVGYAFHTGARAYASAWTAEGGMTILGSQDPSRDSRANDANQDGSVVVGWSADTGYGYWNPTVWEDGVLTVLNGDDAWCEAKAVNPAGTVVVGSMLDTLTNINSAAMWVKNGDAWDEHLLGALPGTFGGGYGNVFGLDLSDDGSVVVGINMMDSYTSKGFVWTLDQGMVQAENYLAGFGVSLPDSFVVDQVTCCSADGSVMAGIAYNRYIYPRHFYSFVTKLVDPSPVPAVGPVALDLGPAHPNPFNPSTSFDLSLPREGRVTVEIFDVRGRLVRTLHEGTLPAGDHVMTWDGRTEDGRTAPSGTYLARARNDRGPSLTRRMMLVK